MTFLILSDLLTAKFQTSLVLLKPECELSNVDLFLSSVDIVGIDLR